MNLNAGALLQLTAASNRPWWPLALPARAQAIEELVIAYNVNLPVLGPDRWGQVR